MFILVYYVDRNKCDEKCCKAIILTGQFKKNAQRQKHPTVGNSVIYSFLFMSIT